MTLDRLDIDALTDAIKDASEAHHAYEQTLGHRDEEWAAWYAHYIVSVWAPRHNSAPLAAALAAQFGFQAEGY